MIKDPVAWFSKLPDGRLSIKIAGRPTEGNWEPLYTHPPCEWVGLTYEERNKLWRDVVGWGDPSHDDEDLMVALEAKLKEKNNG